MSAPQLVVTTQAIGALLSRDASKKKKSLPLSKNAERVSKRRAWAPRETYADMSNGPGYSGESDRRSVMSRANGYRNYSGLGNVAAQKARRGVAAKGARWSLLR
jgi:hypothetical protein